jgi:outer membrane protein TolC
MAITRGIASLRIFHLFALCAASLSSLAQTSAVLSTSTPAPQVNTGSVQTGAPPTLTLQDALRLAKASNPQLQAAITEAGVAHQDKVQARAALLPSVNYNTQYLYTEGNGTASGRFIANNGVHEYLAQGNAHQAISVANVADFRRTQAAEAAAKARAEIAARGLVVTVVQSYYTLVVSQRKYSTAQKAANEGERFFTVTRQLEQGGEVAHSDVVKAEIQYQQVKRDLQEAQLAMQKARLELAVLLFPNFTENFSVVDDMRLPEPLPGFPEVAALASRKNPELRAAVATLQAANNELTVARAGYLPSLSLDYFYGIDASQFATRSRAVPPSPGFAGLPAVENLGYAATASLTLPVWNWGATHSKVKQADLRRQLARVELSFSQRQLLSNIRSFYGEAQIARAEVESLARSAELAAESLHLTTLRYQAGEATVLEVVDAQNTATTARNAYDDGEIRFRLAVAHLQTLTGNF